MDRFTKNNQNNERHVDHLADQLVPWWQKSYRTVGRREVATWKAALIIMFVAGVAAALIWSAKTDFNESSNAAASTTLKFSPTTKTIEAGSAFDLDVVIDTAGGNAINFIELYVNYSNPSSIQLQSITGLAPFTDSWPNTAGQVAVNGIYPAVIDTTAGTAVINLGSVGGAASGTGVQVARLHFITSGAVPNASVSFSTSGLRVTAGYGTTNGTYDPGDLLSIKSGATVTVTSLPVTPIDGVCGSSNGTTVATVPTTNFCTIGTASSVSGSGPWAWTCTGLDGGITANCSAAKIVAVNGSCGSPNGTTGSTTPILTVDSCLTGNASAIAGTGPWTWTCAGTGGGSTANCSVAKIDSVNGACGSSNGTTVATAPTANFCTIGTASSVTGTGPWAWTCASTTGGTTASCSASKTVVTNGTCGSSNGITSATAPTTNFCTIGTASSVTGTGPWAWTCASTTGGTTANCSANKTVAANGMCGSSDKTTVATAPSANLCSAGTSSSVSGSGPWNWTCAGSGGGSPASCSASKTADVTQPATTPVTSPVASSSSDSNNDNNKSSSHKSSSKKKTTPSRTITNSSKTIKRGQILTQRGKKFSKKSFVNLYFSKPGGGFYAPVKIMTSSVGSFMSSYRVMKPVGRYGWYALDIKTGKKSKTIYYTVK